MRTIRVVTASVVAGILSAFLFIGVGGRAAMKFIALMSGHELTFSIEGTLAALVFSTSIGVAGGVVFPLLQRYLPRSLNATGGSFGLMVFVVLIPMLPSAIREEAAALGEYIPLAITVFGLLLMGYGVVLEAMARSLLELSCRKTSVLNDTSYEVRPNLTTQSTHHTHISRRHECKLCESLP